MDINMSKKGIKRMRILIEHMRSLPPWADRRFDMKVHLTSNYQSSLGTSTVERYHRCGTTACALGWAFTCPRLKKTLRPILNTSIFETFGFQGFLNDQTAAFNVFFGTGENDKTPRGWARRAERILNEIERRMNEQQAHGIGK